MCRLSVRVIGPDENDSQAEGVDANSALTSVGDNSEAVEATWLSDSMLLAVGNLYFDPGDSRAMLLAGDDAFGIAIRCMSLGRVNGSPERRIVTAVVDGRSGAARTATNLSMRGSE